MIHVLFCASTALSFILIAVTVVYAIQYIRFKKYFDECAGTIVGFNSYRDGAEGSDKNNKRKAAKHQEILPVIEFTVDDVTHQFEGSYYMDTMKTGDSIQVLYDTSDPSKAFAKSGMSFAMIFTGLLGIVLFVPALLHFFGV